MDYITVNKGKTPRYFHISKKG